MFSIISWPQYFTYIFLAASAYYLFIWIVYFKAKMPVLSALSNLRTISVHAEDQPDEVMTTAQHVIDELRPVFSGRNNKNELILAIQLQLRKYSDWNEPGFRSTINEFIEGESQTICSIRLRDDDLRALWLTA